jgi:hypothetical protein
MTKKNVALVPLFACSLLLTMGALNHQPHFATPAAGASFVALPVALDAGLEGLTPQQLLARAAALLDPAQVPWLHVKTWQKQQTDEMTFEAEGRLLRGPNHCVRLEMTVHPGAESGNVVVVSDGVGLAHACRLPGQPAAVVSQEFLTPEKKTMSAQQIDVVLNAKGCGGPHSLLKDLVCVLEDLKMEVGTWKDNKVIRLAGVVKKAFRDSSVAWVVVPPRHCYVYLDAQTLWPHRIEWWASQNPEDPALLFLQLEFRAPEINHPLSREECVREFTYQPDEMR